MLEASDPAPPPGNAPLNGHTPPGLRYGHIA
jgi:hypothetical protein